jgi:hypothetical protein
METATDGADATRFMERCHEALRQHTGENPRPFLDLWSQADDVSLMGGVGGHQVGFAAVSELLSAAAGRSTTRPGSRKRSHPALAMSLVSRSRSST